MEKEKNIYCEIDWAPILLQLKRGKLVPFLGAGASLTLNGEPGLPTTSELAQLLAAECQYPGADKGDLLRVAQYYSLRVGERLLRDSVWEKLSKKDIRPLTIHRILADWPIKYVLTTNYDNLIERAFRFNDKEPITHVYKKDGDQTQIKGEISDRYPLVYKLHGSLDELESMVITEDNYIDFLISLIGGDPKIPNIIKNIFNSCTILFIGYGLKDWNIRVLLKYFRPNYEIRCFAIQKENIRAENSTATRDWNTTVLYWEHQRISIYNCDALGFVTELDKIYRESIADG